MKASLLVIDPQNDFCDVPGAALPVPGAAADMQRLAAFLKEHREHISGLTVTLDSHPSVAIERTTFWQQANGEPVAPFTLITAADLDQGRFRPRATSAAFVSQARKTVLAMTEKSGGIMVWPVHCVIGTWGHTIYPAVADELAAWEFHRQQPVAKVLKGEHPLTEHFGVFEADVPVQGFPATEFNEELLNAVYGPADVVIWAGEASSHCVASSYRQAAGRMKAHGIPSQNILLRDCMSPVPGFEKAAEAFLEEARADGALVLTAAEAGGWLLANGAR